MQIPTYQKKDRSLLKSTLLSPTRSIVKRNVDAYQIENELPERFYRMCLEEFSKVDPCKVDEKDIKRIVVPFLVNWGTMRRVVRGGKRSGWEKKIAEILRKNCKTFKEFQKIGLAQAKNLQKYQQKIEQIFRQIRSEVGPTATSKILHLISPKFFPMWDRNIRDAIKKEIRIKKINLKIDESSTGYFNFMKLIQKLLQNNPVFSQLSKKYHETPLKICDEYLWWETH
jgi:hypothetical protein